MKAHHITLAGLIAAGIGAASLFFVIGAAIALLVGPVSLGPFSGTLSDALANALPGVTVKYDQAAIEWSRDEGRVNLVILGARVFDSDGRIIAQAPKADIDLAARPFLEGKVEVRRITLVGVQLTLVRTRDGGLRLGVERDTGQQDILSSITDAITATNSKASSLQTFAVRNARIAFLDEVTGLFVVAPRAGLKIETAGPNIAASLDADIEISGHPARVKAGLTLPPKKGPVKGDVEVSGLDIGALGANARTFQLLKGIALTTDFSASFTIDHGAHLADADFGADAHGDVGLPGVVVGPVHVRSARIVGRYDGRTDRLLIDDATLNADRASGHLTGRGLFAYDPRHALSGLSVDLLADGIALDLPGTFAGPVALSRIAMRGRYDIATNDVVIDHFGVAGGSLDAQLAGKVTLVNGQSPAIALKGTVALLPMRDLVRYWPLAAAPGARNWIDENIFAGAVGPIALETHIPAGAFDLPAMPDGALNVVFPIKGAEANYVHGLTHLTGVSGTATLTGDNFVANFDSARVGPLVVGKAHVTIPNLHIPGSPGDIDAHVDGSMQDVLALLDRKPLNYPTRFGISPSDTKGAASLDLSFHVPMRAKLSVDDVGISVKALVNGLDIALGNRSRLSGGMVAFNVDNNKLSANGTASLGTSRVALTWDEEFKSQSAASTRITAKGVLDQAARQALGLRANEYLSGLTPVDAVLTGRHGHFERADIAIDLTPATLSVDLMGINKPAGVPATGRSTMRFAPGTVVRSADVRVAIPGGAVSAAAAFAADGTLAALNLPSVRIGTTDDFSFSYSHSAAGTEVLLKGHSLDGTRIGRRGSKPTDSGAGGASDETFTGPFHIDAKLDRVVLRDGVSVSPFALDIVGNGDRPQSLSLSGMLCRTEAITASIEPVGGARKLSFVTNDAGLLARGLIGLTGMRGGRLEVDASLPGHGSDPAPRDGQAPDYQGTLTLRDTTLTNQPFVARLFTAASFTGMGNLLVSQGLAIDKIEVPFSSKNGVIAVHDATASGPTIGATADGYIDRPKNAVALKGSLIPVFGVDFNQVLNAIPLVGDILTSKKGEGIFAATYAVKGSADEPSVTVNPLSMLTPGILRRIFEGRIPNAAQAPSNAPPVVPQPKAP